MPGYGKPPESSVGDLRWPVTLCARQQLPDPASTGIVENIINGVSVYADIRPVSRMTFIGGEQIDTPITHSILFRWLDNIDSFDVILRNLVRPDGTIRQELFRIRRIAEFGGRQRFIIADAELEKRTG